MPTAVFAAQEEYNELLRYAVVVPSYPHLPSLTATASTVGGPSLSVSHPAQVTSTQTRTVGGVHIVASTEASRVGVQTDEADVITVCPSVHPTTYVGPSVSSRSSVHGLLGFIVTFFCRIKMPYSGLLENLDVGTFEGGQGKVMGFVWSGKIPAVISKRIS